MKKVWTIWKFTIGSFSDERTEEHDNSVAIIRTVIVGYKCSYLFNYNSKHNT